LLSRRIFNSPSTNFEPFFLLRNLRFDSLDHLGEFDFALLFLLSVDVEFLSLAVRQAWEEAAFPEVVVHLIQTARTALAYLSRHRFGMGFCGRTRGVYGRFRRLLGCLLDRRHLRVCAADFGSILTAACICMVSVIWL